MQFSVVAVFSCSMDTRTAAAHFCALTAMLVWGTTLVSMKYLFGVLDPIELLFIRFCISYLILFLLHPHLHRDSLSWKREGLFAVTGLIGVTSYYMFESYAVTLTLSANVAIIVAMAPLFTALLGKLFGGRRLGRGFFIGFGFAICGVVLVEFNGNVMLSLSPAGDALALVASICWAAYSMLLLKVDHLGLPLLYSTRRIFSYGILGLLPCLPFTGFSVSLSDFASVPVVLNVLYLAIVASACCYLIWNHAVVVLGDSVTIVYIYLLPLISMIAGNLVFDEPITWMGALGAGLIICGLAVSQKKKSVKASLNKMK